jgi:hypothetical protein
MAFPSLIPTSRAFDPGDYPIKTFKSQNGAETRILYGSERTNVKLQLSYANIGDASAELFLDHFDETKGTFSTFALPDGPLAGWSANTDALRSEPTTVPTVTLVVTVAASGGGNRYRIDGSSTDNETLTLTEGTVYLFDQSDSSNSGHPLRLSTTSDGTHGGGALYTTGVTTFGTAGSAGAYTRIKVAKDAPTLYYYCVNHSGMGGQINTPAGTVSSESGTPAKYRYESAPQLTQVRPGVSTVTVNLIGVIDATDPD